jgi:hypothetical protein
VIASMTDRGTSGRWRKERATGEVGRCQACINISSPCNANLLIKVFSYYKAYPVPERTSQFFLPETEIIIRSSLHRVLLTFRPERFNCQHPFQGTQHPFLERGSFFLTCDPWSPWFEFQQAVEVMLGNSLR